MLESHMILEHKDNVSAYGIKSGGSNDPKFL
jgi:hypothetical protein